MDILDGVGFLNKVPEQVCIISVQSVDYSTAYLQGYSRLLYSNEYDEPCDDGYDYHLASSRKTACRIKDLVDALDVVAYLLADGFKVSIELEEGKE